MHDRVSHFSLQLFMCSHERLPHFHKFCTCELFGQKGITVAMKPFHAGMSGALRLYICWRCGRPFFLAGPDHIKDAKKKGTSHFTRQALNYTTAKTFSFKPGWNIYFNCKAKMVKILQADRFYKNKIYCHMDIAIWLTPQSISGKW